MTKEYIVIAFTENQIGVLNRITALYLRRKINIESLKVSESSIRGISMFVISAFTTRETIDKLVKQLRNIIDVIQVEYYSNEELITPGNRAVQNHVEGFSARAARSTGSSASGTPASSR